ncbi:MAG: tetratricopeptide repeat protein, partial [Acidobacteria bacterium]|nr:tetratricopeptide repeat protein [Candidatus Polarisedimenticola svalbardensis]
RDGVGGKAWLFGGAFVLLIAGCLSKEIAFALPLVIVAYEICFFRESWSQRLKSGIASNAGKVIIISVCILLVFAGGLVWSYMDLSEMLHLREPWSNRDFNGIERVLTQPRVQMFYLSLLVWPAPSRLNLDHEFELSRSWLHPWSTLPSWLFWAVICILAIQLARKRPPLGFPVLAYLVLHLIESGPINLEIIFEHRMYLPMCALVLALATALACLPQRLNRRLLIGLLCLWAPLAWGTHERNVTWGELLRFHEDCALKSPNKYRPQFNYGTYMGTRGRYAEAQIALENALRIEPEKSEAHNQLGNVYMMTGQLQKAELAYREAVHLEPANAEAVFNIGLVLEQQGDHRGAVLWYMKFLREVPPRLQWMVPEARKKVIALGGDPG